MPDSHAVKTSYTHTHHDLAVHNNMHVWLFVVVKLVRTYRLIVMVGKLDTTDYCRLGNYTLVGQPFGEDNWQPIQ